MKFLLLLVAAIAVIVAVLTVRSRDEIDRYRSLSRM
jgi:hypothetical protein